MQIAADAESLTQFTDLRVMAVVGGIDYEKQKKQLTTPVDIVVATPGRLLDFCRSDVLKLNQVEMLVIDEADRMLNMGFIPDVKAIIQRCPKKERGKLNCSVRRLAKTSNGSLRGGRWTRSHRDRTRKSRHRYGDPETVLDCGGRQILSPLQPH